MSVIILESFGQRLVSMDSYGSMDSPGSRLPVQRSMGLVRSRCERHESVAGRCFSSLLLPYIAREPQGLEQLPLCSGVLIFGSWTSLIVMSVMWSKIVALKSSVFFLVIAS